MNCRECQNHLSDYVDGRLDEARSTHVDAHRSECAACQQTYRLMARAGEVLAAEGPTAPPVGLAERAARAAFAAGQTKPERSFFDRWIPVAWPTAAVAAAAALLLLVSAGPTPGPVSGSNVNGDPVSVLIDDNGDEDDFEGDVLGVETAYEE